LQEHNTVAKQIDRQQTTMAPPAAEEAKTAMAESETVTPEIYGRSGDIAKHLEGIQKQYDTAEKREFYAQVMGDGT